MLPMLDILSGHIAPYLGCLSERVKPIGDAELLQRMIEGMRDA
jgi:hypothetical protein